MISPLNDFAIKVLCEDPNYDVRPNGSIFTLITKTGKRSANGTWRELSNESTNGNYIRVKYDYRDLYLHRIIAQKYIGDLNGLEVNHKDGNPKNNDVSNLELVTRRENQLHSYRVLNRKPSYANAKIDQKTADLIRELLNKGVTNKEIAAQFKLSTATVSEIKAGRTWKKVAV